MAAHVPSNIKYAGVAVNSASAASIVAAVSGKVIKAFGYRVTLLAQGDAPINVTFQDDAGTPVVVIGLQELSAGRPLQCNPGGGENGLCARIPTQGQALMILCSAAKAVFVEVWYTDADAS